jgi:ABC-type cobalamin/Fe3+-siderophores transport system ATPase subunit
MIDRVRLLRYKGFEDFDLRIGRQAILVGPNNAGKTTLIQSLRLASSLIRFARRRNARDKFEDHILDEFPRKVIGHTLGNVGARELSWYTDENLRHEFRQEPTGLAVTFKSKASLRVVWPVEGPAFFYIDRLPGVLARDPSTVRECVPTLGVVPTLLPIEEREEVLRPNYVWESIGTRRTSRHFRNQLYHIRTESKDRFAAFVEFAVSNTPEITAISLRDAIAPGAHELDLYLTEAATNKEKEVYWLGDGLQIWLQVLLHIWLNGDVETLILDEPDVFLHPDLQRRLVSILDDLDKQVVLATHAPEIVGEASKDAVVWIDRTRRRSRRAGETAVLAKLNSVLGSGFNLGLARALRSRVTLFVEGEDMKVLRNIARAVGAEGIRTERGLAVIRLGGFSNWHQVEPFVWLSQELLGNSVKIFVLLDRDYRSANTIEQLKDSLKGSNVHTHVWHRKELESYLLVSEAISRASGLSPEVSLELLERGVQETRVIAQATFIARRQLDSKRNSNFTSVAPSVLPEFERMWESPSEQIKLVPPKDILASVAREAQLFGARPISARSISATIRASELDPEIVNLLLVIENALNDST